MLQEVANNITLPPPQTLGMSYCRASTNFQNDTKANRAYVHVRECHFGLWNNVKY